MTDLSTGRLAVLVSAWIFAAACTAAFGLLSTLIETASDPCIGGGCGPSVRVAFIVTVLAEVALLAAATWLATRSARPFSVRVGVCVLAGLLAPVVMVLGAFAATSLA